MNCVSIQDFYTPPKERILLYITICWMLAVFRRAWILRWPTRNPPSWSFSNRAWVDPEWGTRLTPTDPSTLLIIIQDSTTGATVLHKLRGDWGTHSLWTVCQCHLVRTIMEPPHIHSQWGHIIRPLHLHEKVTYSISSCLFTCYALRYLKRVRSYL